MAPALIRLAALALTALLLTALPLNALPPAEPTGGGAALQTTPAATVEQMAWLAGCWQGQRGEPGTTEHWLPPAGGTMLGVSRTVRQGKTVEFEFMQIRHLADGALAFIAQPSGVPPTTFRVLRWGEREVTFESPSHDFPQRVSYESRNDASLQAAIEGVSNGKPRRIEFAFTRVGCDAPPSDPPMPTGTRTGTGTGTGTGTRTGR